MRQPDPMTVERERFLEDLREFRAPRVEGVFGPAELDGDGADDFDELDIYDVPPDHDEGEI